MYLRYFSVSPSIDTYLTQLLRPPDDLHAVLVACQHGELVGLAAYECLANRSFAEIAFLVDDAHHGLGIGTLLLEHLAAIGQDAGVERFVAQTLTENVPMLAVFRDAGYKLTTSYDHGVVDVTFPTLADPGAQAAADLREGSADFTSVQRLLSPRSVTVVGAGRNPAGLGHQVLLNLVRDGYAGPIYPVNHALPPGEMLNGLHAYQSVTDVPGPVDLVVVAVPAKSVLEVAEAAAHRHARSLVVITAGFAEVGGDGPDLQQQLLDLCRAAGMRLVGPNCMGVANAADDVRLNATFGPALPPPGAVGLMSQSGAVGIAAVEYARAAGVGLSSFVSAGNKADISGNDLLCFWERDAATRVCALYLESFGNPRKFARIAGRVARTKPIVVVKSGRSVEGARGARSHTGAAATPEVAVDALFAQAGVIRADSLSDLFDLVTLLDRSPLPAGANVAVVGNSGGPGVLAADACVSAGLRLPELSEGTRAALEALLPSDASTVNPVDVLADTSAETVRSCLEIVMADPGVDSILAVYTPVRPGETDAVARVLAEVSDAGTKPVIAVMLGLVDAPSALRDAAGRLRVPFHSFPETAASTLGAVARYSAWRTLPVGTPAELDDLDIAGAKQLVDRFLAKQPNGGWMSSSAAAELVSRFGVPVVETARAETADEAVEAADRLGYPVALKAGAGELVHKTEAGGVRLHLQDAPAVRAAFDDMDRRLGADMGGAMVQRMVGDGVETAVGLVNDSAFGPLVMFGLGGVASDLLADRSFRILPMSRQDAANQVRSLRGTPLLFGYRGSESVDVAALEDVLLRTAALAEALPEVAELDLNPVVARPDGAFAVDVKIRLEPRTHALNLLRRMSPR